MNDFFFGFKETRGVLPKVWPAMDNQLSVLFSQAGYMIGAEVPNYCEPND